MNSIRLCPILTAFILLASAAAEQSVLASNADNLVKQAEAARSHMHPEQALLMLNQAIAFDPDNLKAIALRADVLKELGKFDAALVDANKAVSMAPGKAHYLRLRAKIYDMLGRLNETIADYDKALKLEPKDAGCWRNLAIAHRRLKHYKEAARCFEAALITCGECEQKYQLMVYRAEMYFMDKDYQTSLKDYDAIIARFPDLSGGYYGKAKILEIQGNHVQAAQLNEQGRKLDLSLEPLIGK
jgi:tetratricopeptide (TPR) repeat protein